MDLALLNLAFTGPLVHLQELLLPLWRTEMPLVRVIVDMEAAGLAVNEAILNTGKSMLLWFRSCGLVLAVAVCV